MGRLLLLILILAAIVAAVGFHRGWFHVSSNSADDSSALTVTVDKTRLREDEQRAKEKAEALKQQVQAKVTSKPTSPAPADPAAPERP